MYLRRSVKNLSKQFWKLSVDRLLDRLTDWLTKLVKERSKHTVQWQRSNKSLLSLELKISKLSISFIDPLPLQPLVLSHSTYLLAAPRFLPLSILVPQLSLSIAILTLPLQCPSIHSVCFQWVCIWASLAANISKGYKKTFTACCCVSIEVSQRLWTH